MFAKPDSHSVIEKFMLFDSSFWKSKANLEDLNGLVNAL